MESLMFAGNIVAMVVLVYWSIRMEKSGNSSKSSKSTDSIATKG